MHIEPDETPEPVLFLDARRWHRQLVDALQDPSFTAGIYKFVSDHTEAPCEPDDTVLSLLMIRYRGEVLYTAEATPSMGFGCDASPGRDEVVLTTSTDLWSMMRLRDYTREQIDRWQDMANKFAAGLEDYEVLCARADAAPQLDDEIPY